MEVITYRKAKKHIRFAVGALRYSIKTTGLVEDYPLIEYHDVRGKLSGDDRLRLDKWFNKLRNKN